MAQGILRRSLGSPGVRPAAAADRDGRHGLLHGLLRAGRGACRLQVHLPRRCPHRDPLRARTTRPRRRGVLRPGLARAADTRSPPAAGYININTQKTRLCMI